MTVGSPIDERIAAHRARFDELVGVGEARHLAGDPAGAATYAQVAAALAWYSPTGLFASPRLEALVEAVGRGIDLGSRPARRSQAGQGSVGHVLHVFTTAYMIGGHTRLAWRWIERDVDRMHSAALTRQGFEPLPRPLLEAVSMAGGRLLRVDRAAPDLIGRARALSQAASSVDLVVIHAHPFDVVPSLALARLEGAGARPPTILVNHADHLFWIGVGVSDLSLHLRASGARLSVQRRGLSLDQSAILPLPLARKPASIDRHAARRLLGYRDGEVVAVSIASSYKFGTDGGPGLLPIVRRAVERQPALRVLAIGPGDRKDWAAAEAETGGRVRALGVLPDIRAMYAAADIYLDSYPFSSLTSMLEAGQHALPLLAYTDASADADVLAFDDPATDGLPVRAETEGAFLDTLDRLVRDADGRLELGRAIADAIAAVHEGEGWRERLHATYARILAIHAGPRTGRGASGDPSPAPSTELDRRLVDLLDAQQSDAPAGVRGHLRLAPFGVRLTEWRASRRSARPLSPLVLLPDWVLMLGRRTFILARGLRTTNFRRA